MIMLLIRMSRGVRPSRCDAAAAWPPAGFGVNVRVERQAAEALVVRVEGAQRGAVLDGEHGQMAIGGEIAARRRGDQ